MQVALSLRLRVIGKHIMRLGLGGPAESYDIGEI